jgi:hypothetical protein
MGQSFLHRCQNRMPRGVSFLPGIFFRGFPFSRGVRDLRVLDDGPYVFHLYRLVGKSFKMKDQGGRGRREEREKGEGRKKREEGEEGGRGREGGGEGFAIVAYLTMGQMSSICTGL